MSSTVRDNEAHRFPISVKGVVIRDGSVVLLRNRRDEWELPGGKLELDETPEQCVAREIAEELGLAVEPRELLDTWVYAIAPSVQVLIVTYGCVEIVQQPAVISDEHTRLEWLRLDELDRAQMPDGYKRSIRSWHERLRSARAT